MPVRTEFDRDYLADVESFRENIRADREPPEPRLRRCPECWAYGGHNAGCPAVSEDRSTTSTKD